MHTPTRAKTRNEVCKWGIDAAKAMLCSTCGVLVRLRRLRWAVSEQAADGTCA
jgi:hypothetical protein